MSDFLTRITAEANKPIGREVTILGQSEMVYFRLITAAQRHSLVTGKSYQFRSGESAAVTVDLGQNEADKQKLVHFCVANENGSPYFKSLAQVQALPSFMLEALSDAAKSVNDSVFGSHEDASAGES